MTIMQQMAVELMAWNDKLRAGYQLSEIEREYLDGLKKAFLANLQS